MHIVPLSGHHYRCLFEYFPSERRRGRGRGAGARGAGRRLSVRSREFAARRSPYRAFASPEPFQGRIHNVHRLPVVVHRVPFASSSRTFYVTSELGRVSWAESRSIVVLCRERAPTGTG
ncbi:hypothetical protein EVAR_29420_1 [Eumeta japonica]|uniref:Uncharacterized protein n=1 Tax=Eumeta variegata TaxID=151549 RepID=A0A4C1VW38_EUMVA|nr:hypothetical protein EVAR_29420_1 [Eumeta japonica]